jgi:hypothetical protein
MKGVFKRYRKALKEFSNALTLEKLLDGFKGAVRLN